MIAIKIPVSNVLSIMFLKKMKPMQNNAYSTTPVNTTIFCNIADFIKKHRIETNEISRIVIPMKLFIQSTIVLNIRYPRGCLCYDTII